MVARIAGHFDHQLLQMVLKRVLGDLAVDHVVREAFQEAKKPPKRRERQLGEERNELLQTLEGRVHRAACHDEFAQTVLRSSALRAATYQIARLLRRADLQSARKHLHHERAQHRVKPRKCRLSGPHHGLFSIYFGNSHDAKQRLQHRELEDGV